MLKIILALCLVFVLTLLSAWADQRSQSFLIKLEHLSNQTKGSIEEISSDPRTGSCRGHYNQLPWKPLPPQSCRDLTSVFENHHSALIQLQKSPPPQKHPALHRPRGLLQWKTAAGNYEWIVNLATARECDAPELNHCRDPQLDEASALAKKLRELLTQSLGRLPPPN